MRQVRPVKKIKEVIVVEGRYDKNSLSQVVDAVILETAGFGIFNDKQKQKLLRLQQKAITEHKSNINYVNAVDMKLEALSEEEEKQMAADEQADAAKEEAMAETAAQMDELTDNAIKELKEKGIL